MQRRAKPELFLRTSGASKAPFSIKFLNPDLNAPGPNNLDEMIKVSSRLANGFKFVRVDLFSLKNRIYFVELTFHHGAGY